MSNVELFIDNYKLLEKTIREKYKLNKIESPLWVLSQQSAFRYCKDKLDAMREIRNLFQHEYLKDGKHNFIDVNPNLLCFLEEIKNEVEHPTTCFQAAVKQVQTAELENCVLPIMLMMKEKVYTHIPIVDRNKVIGVFSENTVFGYMLQDEIMEISPSTTFHELKEYLALDNRINESFCFIKRNDPITIAEKLFEESFSRSERLNMLFVTHNGKQDEALLGIITPWDLLGRKARSN